MRTFIDGNGGGPAFLASREPCFVGELFTYVLASGTTYRWTSYDISLTVSGNTWLAPIDGAPLVTRNRFGVKNTVEVPELELRLGCTDTLLSNLKTQIHNGLWDGARAEMDRVFMPAPGDTQYGYVLLFNGRQSSAVIDAEGVTMTAKGDNVLMNQQAPRNLYQTNCLHTFCDAGCTLDANDYTFAGIAVAYGSSATRIVYTPPSGFTGAQFTQGVFTMTSGAAIGQVRTIRFANDTELLPTYPLYDAPARGDTFNLLLGCDRQQTSCQNRYPVAGGGPISNIQHYRGYPYTPQAYIAV
ncbi:MAG TPA: DUF2163 domain-containing protein [Rhizomicrobium sp.]|jgi:uncharacterized phage protein (TIGR02218 family)|nr:DUF2163 domain-containing protein [Rhizomicrobium sp.]